MKTKESFNQNELIKLIKKAQGNLTQNEFSKRCGTSSSNFTRIYKSIQRPSPDFLKRVSDNAVEFVSYETLMIAAGYWERKESFDLLPVKNIFNYRLKKLREEAGYTIDELADISGVLAEQIHCFEENIPVDFCRMDIIKLAKALNVYSDYLTGESMYKTFEEEKEAYQSLDLLSEQLQKLGDDFNKTFIYQLNRILALLIMYESTQGGIRIPEYKYSLRQVLKKIKKIYENNLAYTNLYNNYNYFHSDNKIATKEDLYSLDGDKKLEADLSVTSLYDSSLLATIENVNEINKIFKDFGEDILKKYYVDVYNNYYGDEDVSDDDDD
ncbi:MAG: hypothetical protein AB9836_08285 [Aminipila sp.]